MVTDTLKSLIPEEREMSLPPGIESSLRSARVIVEQMPYHPGYEESLKYLSRYGIESVRSYQ